MMKNNKPLSTYNKRIAEAISLLLIVVFAYTAYSKLSDTSVFIRTIMDTGIFGSLAPLVAYSTIAIELIIVAAFIYAPARQLAFMVSIILLALFTMYLLFIVVAFEKMPCSCGGLISTLTFPQHIAFNSALLLIACTGLWLESRNMLIKTTAQKLHFPSS